MLLAVSCTGKSNRKAIADKANAVHLEAIALYDEAHTLHDSLKQEAQVKMDSLLIGKLDSIHDVMHDWEKGLYEVPGYEHSHSDHDHKHEHKSVPNMTNESMLDYQNNAKEAISEIKEALQHLGRPD